MAEEKKESWLNYLALTTVFLAVCATLSTFKGGSYSTRSVLSQAMASDQWAYYQSKSLKEYLYEIQKEGLEFDLTDKGDTLAPESLQALKSRIDTYGRKMAKYESEKSDIMKEAKKLEEIRDDAQKHQKHFGLAVIFLQIGILLSSISALMKKKPVWVLGLAVGVIGIFYFANGFFLFIE